VSKYIMVTGAAGFIGRHVVRALADRGDRVYAVDANTYAADMQELAQLVQAYPEHIRPDICDVRSLTRLPDVGAVIHLAASTHVDNSLTEGEEFVANNVGSTAKLLELVRGKAQHGMPHLIHVSTDEVYGTVARGSVSEAEPLRPSSPYAASKAAADMLVHAWVTTYNVPATIVRPTNVYGTGQYPEKLIPKCVRNAQLGKPIPIHGDGTQTRCWLDVADLVSALLLLLDRRELGVFNVGGNTEASVMHVANTIGEGKAQLAVGYKRPAGDLRYAVDDTRLRRLGWTPQGDFWRDLPLLVTIERKRWRW
jgi:dTDP-glucose 4,6-dehydratase